MLRKQVTMKLRERLSIQTKGFRIAKHSIIHRGTAISTSYLPTQPQQSPSMQAPPSPKPPLRLLSAHYASRASKATAGTSVSNVLLVGKGDNGIDSVYERAWLTKRGDTFDSVSDDTSLTETKADVVVLARSICKALWRAFTSSVPTILDSISVFSGPDAGSEAGTFIMLLSTVV